MRSDLTPDKLRRHIGHTVVIVTYAGENVALECEDCSEVLADANLLTDEDRKGMRHDREVMKEIEEKPRSGPRPGVFDLRKQLGRAPTAKEYRDARR